MKWVWVSKWKRGKQEKLKENIKLIDKILRIKHIEFNLKDTIQIKGQRIQRYENITKLFWDKIF